MGILRSASSPTRTSAHMSTETPNDPAGGGTDHPVPTEAVAAAADAFETFSRTSRETRAMLLDALADVLEVERATLVAAADAETFLGAARLDGEVSRTAFQLRRFGSVARRGDYLDATIDTALDAPPPAGRPDLRAMRVPLGPVAVYAASNFPFAFSTLGGDTASALAAGCTVVVKPHPGHLETSRQVAEARVGEAATHPLLNDRIRSGFEAAVGAAADHAAVRLVAGDATAGTHTVLETGAADALAEPALLDEMFGPAALIVRYADADEAARVLGSIAGSLTASLHAEEHELDGLAGSLLPALQRVSGRLLFEGVPPGVAVTGAMQHGGPWPSSSRSDSTSVGDRAIERWLRRVAWQSAPGAVLPEELRDVGPDGLARTVDGVRTAAAVGS